MKGVSLLAVGLFLVATLLILLYVVAFGAHVVAVAVIVSLANVGYLVLLSLVGEKLNLDWERERELALYGSCWIIFGTIVATLHPEYLVPAVCALVFAGVVLFSCGRLSATYLAFGVGIVLGTTRGDLAWLAPLPLAVGGVMELVLRLRRACKECEP